MYFQVHSGTLNVLKVPEANQANLYNSTGLAETCSKSEWNSCQRRFCKFIERFKNCFIIVQFRSRHRCHRLIANLFVHTQNNSPADNHVNCDCKLSALYKQTVWLNICRSPSVKHFNFVDLLLWHRSTPRRTNVFYIFWFIQHCMVLVETQTEEAPVQTHQEVWSRGRIWAVSDFTICLFFLYREMLL